MMYKIFECGDNDTEFKFREHLSEEDYEVVLAARRLRRQGSVGRVVLVAGRSLHPAEQIANSERAFMAQHQPGDY